MGRTKTEKLPPGWRSDQWQERRDALLLLPKRVQVLLAAEWARSVLHIFEKECPGDDRPRKAIEIADQYGTTGAAAAAYNAAYNAAYAAANNAAANAAYAANNAANNAAANNAAYAAYAANADNAKNRWRWLHATYKHARVPRIEFNPGWRTETVVSLAQGIVSDRAFDRMPIMADALQDAGCDCPELMHHLQSDTDEFTLADWTIWNVLDFGTNINPSQKGQ